MGRLSIVGRLGAGPGCLTQIELMAALLAAIPAFVEPRSTGAVRAIAGPLGLLAAVFCFWTLVLFNWHVLRRLFFDASGPEISRPERVRGLLFLSVMALLALGSLPCWALGHLIVSLATFLVPRSR